MQINVSFDSSVSSAPASFVAAINYVVNYYDTLFTNNVTINLNVGYGEVAGQTMGAGALGESYSPTLVSESYASVVSALQAEGAPGASALSSTSPLSGALYMTQTEAQALGLTNAVSTGYVGFSSSLPFSYTANATPASNAYYFIGAAEHEITEVMGRASLIDGQPGYYALMDLYRFTAASVHDTTAGGSGSTAYFSINNGVTNLGTWNNSPANGDLGDWYPSGPAAGGNDSFNDYTSPGVINVMSANDVTLMQALGWTTQPAQPSGSIAVTANIMAALQGGGPVTLLASAPSITDSASTTLASATIKIANGSGSAVAGDALYVNGVQNGSVGNGVTASWNAATGTLTLTGNATIAVYQALLSEVSYQDTGTDASNGSHPVRVVTWNVNDGTSGYSTTSQVTIDRTPVASNSTASDAAGSTVTATAAAGVLSHATDADGDSLTVTGVSDVTSGAGSVGTSLAGAYGHLTLNANGSYSYVADKAAAINSAPSGSHLQDTFSYIVSDGNGGSATAALTVTLDRAPVASNSTASDTAGSTVTATAGAGVLSHANDADGDPLTVVGVSDATSGAGTVGSSLAGAYGHLTLNADGSYSYVADKSSAINSAPTGSHLQDTFTYTVSDGNGGTSTASLTVALDRAPVANNSTASDLAGSTVTATAAAGVLSHATDADGDSLTVTGVSDVTSGAGAVGTSLAGAYGHLTLNADGSYSYVADKASAISSAPSGSHLQDAFTYTVSDGNGGTSTASLTVTLDRAAVVSNSTASDAAGSTVTATAAAGVLSHATDADGDSLTVTGVSDTTSGAGAVGTSLAGAYGHLTLNADGSYSYVADKSSAINSAPSGSHLQDAFTFTVSDGSGGTTTATLTVTLDRAPVANNSTASDAAGSTVTATAAAGVLSHATDADGDSLTVTGVSDTTSGAGSVGTSLAGAYGHLTLNANGSYSYVADKSSAISSAPSGSHLQDTFTYTVSDGNGGTSTASLTVTLDRAPVASNSTASDAAGSTVTATAASGVLSHATDADGDSLTVTGVSDATSGAGTVGTSLAGAYGHLTLNANGSYSYVADKSAAISAAPSGSNLQDTFSYAVSDGDGGTATATLTVTLDRAPVASNSTASDAAGSTVTATSGTGVLSHVSDADGDALTVIGVSDPTSGAGTVGASLAGAYGHLTLNADGSYSYVADKAAAISGAPSGSHLQDTFTYTVSDGDGGTATASLTVTLDRAPVASNSTASDPAGSTVTATAGTGVLSYASDADGDPLTVIGVSDPTSGAGTVGASLAGAYGHLTLNADGSYSYVADKAAAISGAPSGSHLQDTFTYTVSDGDGGTATASLTVTLDRAPVASNSTASDPAGSTVTATAGTGVLSYASDADGDPLTVIGVSDATSGAGTVGTSLAGAYGHLTLNANGSYSYVADKASAINSAPTGSHLQDNFSYTVSDGHGGTAMASLAVTLDRAPVAQVANVVLSSASVAASSLLSASDPDGNAITTFAFEDTGAGHFVLNGVVQANNQEIDVTAAQLSQLTYQSMPGSTDTLEVRVNDGTLWSNWGSFTVTAPGVVIESSGSTSLIEVGNNFEISCNGSDPALKYAGMAAVAGQFGGWTPIAAEATGSGYEVAWKVPGLDQYTVWNVDSSGNYTGNAIGVVSGNSSTLESLETSFHQDLNGDGTIGIPTTVIETSGSTSLVQIEANYFLNPVGGGTGPELKFGGAAAVAGQFGAWTPIAAEATGSGYEVAWKVPGLDQYTVWNVDSSGNYTGNAIGAVSGNSSALESLETSFHQDLNGDGTIGIPTTVIEASGSTSLVQIGANYFLDPVGGGTGPELKFDGAVAVAGQFGAWTPIAAEATGNGYEVAWKVPGLDQYTVWNVDSSGNYTGNASGAVSGNSSALESLETSFHQDLNGDGAIGIPTTVVEASGSTSLVQIGANYFLDPVGGGTGPELKFDGAAAVAGQFGAWTPIAAEATGNGYEVAWKVPGLDQYTVWNVDSSGNYTGNAIGAVSGNSSALESLETSFHQDLNGDGAIGIPTTVIEASGSTSLVQIGANYFLDPVGGGTGPELKFGGAAAVAGQFGGWTPIAAEATGSGYEVAWKVPGLDQYTVWNVDSSGNYTGNAIGAVSGNSSALESLETSFHQDLNGDGAIGLYVPPSTVLQINSPLAGAAGAATIGTGATLELAAADSSSVTFNSATGMLKLDHSSTFSGEIFNFTGDGSLSGSDQIDLKDIGFNSVHDSYANGVLTVTDGTSAAELAFNGSYVLANFKFASDGSGGTIVYDPPVPASNPTTPIAGTAPDATLTGNGGRDNFVFNPHLGQATITNFAPGADAIQFDHTAFSKAAAVLAATHDDSFGNAGIGDAAHDAITFQHVTTAQLLAHQSDFHF